MHVVWGVPACYLVAPSAGIYLVVLSVLLHAVGALESSILEEGTDAHTPSSVSISGTPLATANGGDIRHTSCVLQMQVVTPVPCRLYGALLPVSLSSWPLPSISPHPGGLG